MTDTDADSATPPKEAPAGELPFDPFRLAGGILKRWQWLVGAALAGLALALVFGLFRAETRYEVSVQLIRREVPASFRAGDTGEAYRPRQIGTATLVGAAMSDNVLARVSAKSKPAVPLKLLRLSFQANEVRNTDFLTLTVSGYHSAAATAALANLWGGEVVEFSRELQTRESREVRQYLQQQLTTTDADLAKINQEIIQVSRRDGIVDAEKQMDVFLRTLGDLDLRCETARIDMKTADFKIRALENELTQHTAVGEKLAAARADLEAALLRYTDQNPQVIELRAHVENLEKSAATTADAAKTDKSSMAYTGSPMGSTLYLQLVELRAEREGLGDRLSQLEALREQSRLKLETLPEKSAGVARLVQTRHSLEVARNLLYSRLREAQLFEERSPGYYQLFSSAAEDGVAAKQKWLKVLIYAAIGLVFGSGFGGACALASELLDERLRTAAEARRVFKTSVAATLPEDPDAAALVHGATQMWPHWPAPHESAHRPAVAWVPHPSPAETKLWQELVREAERLLPHLLIVDVGSEAGEGFATVPSESPDVGTATGLGCWRIDGAKLTMAEARVIAEKLKRLAAQRPVWVRLTGPVREPLTTLVKGAIDLLIMVQTDDAKLSFWLEQAQRLRLAGLKPGGLVVLGVTPWWRSE